MEKSKKIVWTLRGQIIDHEAFQKVKSSLIEMMHNQSSCTIFWWTLTPDREHYCVLSCCDDSDAVIEHLKMWATHHAQMAHCATLDGCAIFGDASDELKREMEVMNPTYQSYFGGFSKAAPHNKQSEHSDIMWALSGEIINEELFERSMLTLTEKTHDEEGSLMHWWTLGDGNTFHVLERYADHQAAVSHLETWGKYGGDFLDSTSIESFTTFGNLTSDLEKAVKELKPIIMRFDGGYAR